MHNKALRSDSRPYADSALAGSSTPSCTLEEERNRESLSHVTLPRVPSTENSGKILLQSIINTVVIIHLHDSYND